jgi:hypothetical protein
MCYDNLGSYGASICECSMENEEERDVMWNEAAKQNAEEVNGVWHERKSQTKNLRTPL